MGPLGVRRDAWITPPSITAHRLAKVLVYLSVGANRRAHALTGYQSVGCVHEKGSQLIR